MLRSCFQLTSKTKYHRIITCIIKLSKRKQIKVNVLLLVYQVTTIVIIYIKYILPLNETQIKQEYESSKR